MPSSSLARDHVRSSVSVYDFVPADYAAWAATLSMSAQMDVFANIARSGRILDAGCGSGRDLAELAARGYDAHGVDLSAELARIAARTGRPVAHADLRALPYTDGFFDGLWSCASLVHFGPADAAIALAEMRRVVRYDGALFATVKAGDDTGGWEPSRFGNRWYQRWTANRFTEALATAGFDVTHTIDADGWIEAYGRAV